MAPRHRSRSYTFTVNNWTDEQFTQVKEYLDKNCSYIFQAEIGKQGTPHLQGVMRYKYGRSWEKVIEDFPVKPDDGAHIETCRSWTDSINYCSKSDTKDPKYPEPWTNIKSLKGERPCRIIRKNLPLHAWQKRVLEIIKEPKDDGDRRIIWVHDKKGGAGKSEFNRYLRQLYKGRWCSVKGNARDIKCGIALWKEKKDDEPHAVSIDLSRTQRNHVSYDALEDLSNGYFFSGKYESCEVYLEYPPWILIFANMLPRYGEMSEDRWEIIDCEAYK